MPLFIIIFLHLSSVFLALGGNQQSLGGGCPLPETPENGNFEVSECVEGDFSSKCRKISGTIVSEYVVLTYWCNPGYVLPENIKHSICTDGNWVPQLPSCQKPCKGLISNTVDLKCFYHGRKVDCGEPMRPGTVLKASCKDATYQISDPSASFSTTLCLPDGTWLNELYTCVPDCGIRTTNDTTPTLKGISSVNQSEFPWHAGLYKNEGQDLVYLCGGTIIHPKAVLTAAFCVYNFTSKSAIDEKEIQVAVGKYRSSWNITDISEQKFRVKKIIIEDKFVGDNERYEHDIAILELDRFIVMNHAVMPICFDRREHLTLYKESNAIGTVVRGVTGAGAMIRNYLTVAKFQFLDYQECLKRLHKSYFISYDKFCARSSQDTILQREDTGNGLTFPRSTYFGEQHFIYGILSLGNVNGVVAFTNITEHMKWIDKVLSMIV